MTYSGPERRKHVQLSDEDFERSVTAAADAAAPKAKELAKQEIYLEAGKLSVKAALFWLRWILLSFLAVATGWLVSKGYFKP